MNISKKKLLYVVNIDKFLLSHRFELAIEAKRNNFEVHLGSRITSTGKILNKKGIKTHPIYIDRSSIGLFELVKTSISIFRLIKKIKPDIVHFISIKPVTLGCIACKFLSKDINIFASISGLGYIFVDRSFLGNLKRIITCIIYKFALSNKSINVIFQNETDKNYIKNLCNLKNTNCHLIKGSGVNLKKFKYVNNESYPPEVIFPARLVKSKGIIEFINAAKILKGKGRFIICGDYDFEAKDFITEEIINNEVKKGNIEYWGFQENIGKIFTNASLIVLPSYREGFSKVLCEASACGKPIVTTNVPGCKDAVRNNITGILVPPRDYYSLIKAIDKLLSNQELRIYMGKEGRIHAEKNFDVQKVIKTHLNLYKYSLKI